MRDGFLIGLLGWLCLGLSALGFLAVFVMANYAIFVASGAFEGQLVAACMVNGFVAFVLGIIGVSLVDG